MDYNIYIHDSTGSSSQTEPWKAGASQTQPWGQGAGDFQKVLETASNPDSLIPSFSPQMIAKLGKLGVAVACAYAVVKVADKVASEYASWLQVETGDSRANLQLQEFHTTIRNMSNPFSTAINYIKAEQSYRVQNLKQAQNKLLLGDSLDNGGVSV